MRRGANKCDHSSKMKSNSNILLSGRPVGLSPARLDSTTKCDRSYVLQQHSNAEKPKKSYCGVMNCVNNSINNPELSYFRLPSNPERAEVWLQKIHRVKNRAKKILVCEVHFERRYVNMNETRKRLVRNAVPSLLLPETIALECTPDVDDVDEDVDDDGDDDDDDEYDNILSVGCTASSARKTKHLAQKEKLRKTKRKRVNEAKGALNTFLENNTLKAENSDIILSKIIKLHTNFRAPSRGEKCTDEFKFFALKLYFASPKTYQVVQSVLNLPSISTLYRLCIPSTTEVCENLIIALKIKVDTMADVQKQCAVCIGTLELKEKLDYDLKNDKIIGFHDVDGIQRLEPAKTALVVMVRGIFDNWKQAVAFSLLAHHQDYEDVREYIVKIIRKMFDIGLNVRVFISDIESDKVGISKKKIINSREQFFFVNGKKVYYMYDAPHLVKVVRDNLTTHDFLFNRMVAKWEHITKCYDHDCKQALRLAPKLTSYHIIPTDMQSENDKVKLAAEIFSKTTAAAISTYADLKVLDESAKETVQWIIMMNNLYEMLNFRSVNSDEKQKSIFSGEAAQVTFLNEMMSVFKNLCLIDLSKGTDATHNAKFIKKFCGTIQVVLSLHKDLNSENYMLPFIGLSRDCLDTFFDKIRHQHGSLPTSNEITLSVRKMPIFTVFQCNSKKKRSDNLEYFLMEARKFSDIEMYEQVSSEVNKIEACRDLTGNINFNSVELSKQNSLQYMAAYLLYEGYQQHRDCGAMKRYVLENDGSTTDITVILTIKSKTETNDSNFVTVVHKEFFELIESMELTFKLYFETEYPRHPLLGLKQHLLVDNITFSMPCECFPLDFIKVLYIRYRLHILLNYNNKEFQICKGRRKYFSVNEL